MVSHKSTLYSYFMDQLIYCNNIWPGGGYDKSIESSNVLTWISVTNLAWAGVVETDFMDGKRISAIAMLISK